MTVSWTKKSKNKHVRGVLPSLVSAVKVLGKTYWQLHFFSGNEGGGGGGWRRGSTPTHVAQDKLRGGVMG